jgi:hypothetical protein
MHTTCSSMGPEMHLHTQEAFMGLQQESISAAADEDAMIVPRAFWPAGHYIPTVVCPL